MIFDLEIDKCCQRHNGPNALTCTASRKPCMNSISEWVEQCASMLLYVNCCHIDTFLPAWSLEFLSRANSGQTDGCILVLWSERLRPHIGGNASDLELTLQAFVFPFDTHWGQQESCRKTCFSDRANIKHRSFTSHAHASWIFSSTYYLTDQNGWICKPHTLYEISRIKGKGTGPYPNIWAPLDLI